MAHDYVLKLHCPDRPGILAAISTALSTHGGDVRDAASFGDEDTGEFFVRMTVRLAHPAALQAFRDDVSALSERMGVRWELHDCSLRQQVLILASKLDHCLLDLLHRWKSGALAVDIPLVISNHDANRSIVEWHGIPYLHLPVTKETKAEQEAEILKKVDELDIDLVVLARYMQVLSNAACKELDGRCINIHHSFLPSFKGAMPYRQAHERGVKLIGATAHYITEDLDEGPIIEQDVRRVSHSTSAAEMAAIGRETESSVLSRAVRWHLEHRILMNGSKTVVFT